MTTTIAGAQNTLTKLEAFVSDTIDNTVEGSDDGVHVDGVGEGARNGAQCAQISRGYRP